MAADPAEFAEWLASAPASGEWPEARLSLLDTLDCMAAGARSPLLAKLQALEMPLAVRLAVAGHYDDFDDSELIGSTHPSTVLYAALMALAKKSPLTLGQALDGYEAGIAAIQFIGGALGYGHYARGFHASSTVGVFGAAAACARALRLNADQTADALSLAASQSAGLKTQFGTDAKGLQLGFAAHAGLQAAGLAQCGITTATETLPRFIELYGENISAAPPGKLAIPPGVIFRKLWPCCHYSHRILHLCQLLQVPSKDIQAVRIAMPAPFLDVVARRAPETAQAAKFSLSWCAAALLTGGTLDIACFETGCGRPDISRLEACIELVPEDVPPDIEDLSPDHPDQLSITLASGETLTRSAPHVPGSLELPVSADQLIQKYRSNCAVGGAGEDLSPIILHGEPETDLLQLLPPGI
ncbi:hypothetical protein RA19_01310 [Leisingera sp. ANG-M1]|uniref:MmgE/PrpD family protein n=1 Tax=Leisingera sp. ANG-M1 TaxID=1577895 RepID=UPI00057F6E45|nr:MmgE/PrpD family protein [Leisingera sp. ANG-M1]KIC12547.1 hypothetical protein RA19_01310 [Leisingera sp. ANG-M1]